jgi:hypothetical protein
LRMKTMFSNCWYVDVFFTNLGIHVSKDNLYVPPWTFIIDLLKSFIESFFFFLRFLFCWGMYIDYTTVK